MKSVKYTTTSMLKALTFCGLLFFGLQAVAADSSSTVSTDLVRLSKTAPAKVAVGETFEVTYTIEARQDVANVVVSDVVPTGAKLERSEPQAAAQGANLSWTVPLMSAGDKQTMKVFLTPQGVGTLASCATVTAEPRACVATVVGRPELAIVKSGPAQTMLGSNVKYLIVVRNTGNSEARNVVVVDTVPAGFTHESGKQEVRTEVGTLAPGASHQVEIFLKANERGEFCNKASATATGVEAVEAQACTVVKDQQLEIVKTGPEREYIGRNARYEITVTNPGDVELTNVVVTDKAPAGTTIVSAAGGEINRDTVTWRLATLAAGAKQSFTLVLTSREPGTHTNVASVATAEGLRGQATAPTLWEGYPALLIELIDTIDPLQPGDHTDYVITVTNQGTAQDRNIRIKATFPPETKPVSGSGHTEATLAGQLVTTAPYAVLQPKQVISWTIRAEAVKPGDSRLKVELTSDLLQTPVTVEESTQVY